MKTSYSNKKKLFIEFLALISFYILFSSFNDILQNGIKKFIKQNREISIFIFASVLCHIKIAFDDIITDYIKPKSRRNMFYVLSFGFLLFIWGYGFYIILIQ